MKKANNLIHTAGLFLVALAFSLPLSAAESISKDSIHAGKPAGKDDHGHDLKGHDHDAHGKEGHEDHGSKGGHDEKEAHGHKSVGMGKTDIREISAALRENLACVEKEMASANHDVFHGCLEAIGSLGQDLTALKTPVEPAKKKRVNGYAKNLDQMTHKVDEYIDAGKTDLATAQLKKLRSQVELIESQFSELSKKDASAK